MPDVDRSDPDAAVDAAARSFPSWSRPPRDVRKAAAGRVIETLGEHADELATLLAAEGRSMGVAQWEIKWITDLYGSALPSIDLTEERWVQERVGQVVKRYVPLGVVCAISPWNLPFMLSTADGANSSVDAMSQFSRPLRQPGSLSLGVMPYAVDPEAGDRLWSLSERTSGPSPSPGLPRINTVAVVA